MKKSKGISRNRLETFHLAKEGLSRKKNMSIPRYLDSKSSAKKMNSPKVLSKTTRKS